VQSVEYLKPALIQPGLELHNTHGKLFKQSEVIDKADSFQARQKSHKALMMLVLSFIVGLVVPSGVLIGGGK